MFESDKIDQGWDGNYKGNPAPDGVYTYYTEITSADNKVFTFKGTLTLLR
jgi:hypothetical protein